MSEMPAPEESTQAWLAERPEESTSTEAANGTAPDGAEAPVVADSTPSMTDSGREPAVPFLQSLTDAMRKIADQTREDALGKLRAAVAERSAEIHAETEHRAAELHEAADADVAAVGKWEQGELDRIRAEAATKVSARNTTLEAQLAANTAAGEGAMAAVEARVDAFEAEMTSFFAQLNDVHDPAALASALKRIPQPPSLTDAVAAPAGDTAPSPAAAPESAEPATASAEPEPEAASEPAPEGVATTASEPEMPSQVDADGEATSPSSVAVATAPEPMSEAADVAEPAAEAAGEAAAEPAAEEPAAGPVEEATTQVVVTGLTSFGAITSFKQSLERVEGINRVSLGLGTSGEFIFTAVHRAGFDLAAAIRSFEESAQFAASNGQLRVTVGSKA